MEGCMQRERLKLKKKRKTFLYGSHINNIYPDMLKKNERNGDSLNVIIAEKKKKKLKEL